MGTPISTETEIVESVAVSLDPFDYVMSGLKESELPKIPAGQLSNWQWQEILGGEIDRIRKHLEYLSTVSIGDFRDSVVKIFTLQALNTSLFGQLGHNQRLLPLRTSLIESQSPRRVTGYVLTSSGEVVYWNCERHRDTARSSAKTTMRYTVVDPADFVGRKPNGSLVGEFLARLRVGLQEIATERVKRAQETEAAVGLLGSIIGRIAFE